MLEHTGGYYLPMAAGATVTYARSAQQLSEDFDRIQPTVIISVPRVFERVYAKVQELLAAQSALVRKVFMDATKDGSAETLDRLAARVRPAPTRCRSGDMRRPR